MSVLYILDIYIYMCVHMHEVLFYTLVQYANSSLKCLMMLCFMPVPSLHSTDGTVKNVSDTFKQFRSLPNIFILYFESYVWGGVIYESNRVLKFDP